MLGGNVAERAVAGGLVADVGDLLLQREHDGGLVLLGADEVLELGSASPTVTVGSM